MKKLLLITSLFSGLAMLFTSCLKDKGFENGLYGINDPGSQPPGIGFPRAATAKYSLGIDLSASAQAITGIVYVNLESGLPATSDVHITLTLNDALRTAYNAANGTNILALPANLFSVPLSLTIPAGQRNAQVAINFPNTSTLDPNKSYGLGLTITSVDGGYLIASNLKNLFIEIGLKNKYDGVWDLKGIHNRAPYNQFPFHTEVEMWTTGPSSVAMFWPDGGDFGQPIGVGPGQVNWYGNAVSPNFTFNPATDIVTGVNVHVGAAVTLAMVTSDNVADSNPNGPIVNRFEAGSPKKMYLTYQYNGNDLRRFYDTLTYIGPR
ncbi:MAG: DUF1735 domain-containing protein [Ferruginibacter sp.]|nr:DUF1735 domain-containing protein [Chitinophagaceae bacterium]